MTSSAAPDGADKHLSPTSQTCGETRKDGSFHNGIWDIRRSFQLPYFKCRAETSLNSLSAKIIAGTAASGDGRHALRNDCLVDFYSTWQPCDRVRSTAMTAGE